MAKFINFIVFMIVWVTGCYLTDINVWNLFVGGVLAMISIVAGDLAEVLYIRPR